LGKGDWKSSLFSSVRPIVKSVTTFSGQGSYCHGLSLKPDSPDSTLSIKFVAHLREVLPCTGDAGDAGATLTLNFAKLATGMQSSIERA